VPVSWGHACLIHLAPESLFRGLRPAVRGGRAGCHVALLRLLRGSGSRRRREGTCILSLQVVHGGRRLCRLLVMGGAGV
jgi:hypothetical protein